MNRHSRGSASPFRLCLHATAAPQGRRACTSLHWVINPSTSRRAAHAAISGSESKGTPEMERGHERALHAALSAFDGQAGRGSGGADRLQQVVKEPGPQWVDALGGSAGAAKRWKGKKAAMKKARNHLVAGPLLERSGGRTLWGYCPALQPPPGGGAVSSKPLLPSHCGWLPLPCKYALDAMRCCDADSRLARDGMDAECTWENGDDPCTATAPWHGRRRMAVRMAFTMGFRRKVVRWWSRGGGHGVLMDGDCK